MQKLSLSTFITPS